MIFELDKDTLNIIEKFKEITDKQNVSDLLALKTVHIGRKRKSPVLRHFYGQDEPVFITESCISFGLMNFMEEDFFVVKEVLGYDYIMNLLDNSCKQK